MNLAQYYRLWQLGRRRLRSEEDYRVFQAYQAELMLGYFAKHRIEISGKTLVDLGSGVAGYSQYFAKQGAKVISIDLSIPAVLSRLKIKAIRGNALHIPLVDKSGDLVVCASLIEHLDCPESLISEIERILKVGGICYLSFPPFYSPRGGHEFAPYHYLGEKLALKLKHRRHVVPQWVREFYRAPMDPKTFTELYPDWGLYRMTIRRARQLVADSGLNMIDMSTRYLPVGFARWPLLGEILTWHVQFLLSKSGRIR